LPEDEPAQHPNAREREAALLASLDNAVVVGRLLRDADARVFDYWIEDANPACETHLGIPRERARGRLGSEVFGHGDRLADLTRVAETRVPCRFDGFHDALGKHLQITVFSSGDERVAFMIEDFTAEQRTQRALAESEERGRLAVSAAQLGIWRLEPSTQLLYLDERARAHVGVKKETLSIEELLQLSHPDDRARVALAFTTGLDPANGRASVDHRVGQGAATRWLSVRASVRFVGGRPVSGMATSQDITERKLAEEALRESEERFRAMFEHAAVGVAMVESRTGRFVRVNARYAEIVGRTPDEMVGRSWRDITVAEDLAADDASLAELVDGAVPRYRKEKRYRHKDGHAVWVDLTVSRTWQEGQAPTFHVTVVEDITARKQAELGQRESEDRYRTLVENIDGVVFSTDVGGLVTFASRTVTRYGWTPEALVGKPLDPLIHPEDLPRLKQSRAERMAGAPPGPFDFRLVDAAGHVHHVRSMTRPLVLQGRVVGLTGVLVDVTHQRDTEEQLRFAQKMEAIGRLAGGVAHDFNNLLSVIGMYTDLAMEQVSPAEPLREDLEEIRRAGLRAQALTRQLLAFSRRQILKPQPLDLNALIGGVEKMLMRVIGEDVEFSFEPGPLLGRTMADPGQIEQVLMNLVINSRDAMPDGGRIRIETSSLRVDGKHPGEVALSPGDYVSFSVGDTGMGMDQTTRARIFEPFFTTKPAGKGTGLGLAMVYGIVQQSGGAVEVESEPGAGATFRVFLPADSRLPLGPAAHKEPTAKASGGETVLVVEDEVALRHLVQRVLSGAGYEVIVASSGREALAAFEQHPEVRLLVTDVVMPEMDGPALAALLLEKAPKLAVLYISGYSDEVIANRGVLAPDVSLLEKPFTSHALLGNVRHVLDRAPR